MSLYYSICLWAIALMLGLKIIFWSRTKRKSVIKLLRSFIRNFSIYDMHDAPSDNDLIFWKVTNFTNLVIWAALTFLIFGIIFTTSIF